MYPHLSRGLIEPRMCREPLFFMLSDIRSNECRSPKDAKPVAHFLETTTANKFTSTARGASNPPLHAGKVLLALSSTQVCIGNAARILQTTERNPRVCGAFVRRARQAHPAGTLCWKYRSSMATQNLHNKNGFDAHAGRNPDTSDPSCCVCGSGPLQLFTSLPVHPVQ